MRYWLGLLVSVFLGIGLAQGAWAEQGIAWLEGTTADSQVTGKIVLEKVPGGLHIVAALEEVPPGKHGFHIHTFGVCKEAGTAAGGHFNPQGRPHGFLPKDGMAHAHGGDLGNIIVGEDGKGTLDLTVPGLTLTSGPYAVAGRAFILHALPDDFGQPTGNAGGRIGCAPIVLSKD